MIRKRGLRWRNRSVGSVMRSKEESTARWTRAPHFTELAAAPGMTDMALSVALTTPHAGMPMFMFTADERQDVIAYILSLR